MARRIFVDTEWTAVPWSSKAELLWIGLADEDGRSWCALSSDAQVDPANENYVSDLMQIITPDVPRLARVELSLAVQTFCGQVDEFWAWIPTPDRFAEWSRLGDRAMEVFVKVQDIDLQMLRALVTPWPKTWPSSLRDLNATAIAAGVEIPPRTVDYLHPRVHAEWNRKLYSLVHRALGNSDA
jgi:hypothetical protein